MLYKTVGFAAASAVCALMVGCANTTTGKMVEPLEVMPTEVCIIQNPKVTIGEAIPSLQSVAAVGLPAPRHQDDSGPGCRVLHVGIPFELPDAAFVGRNDLPRSCGTDAL